MAFGALVALERRTREGGSWLVRISLAQTGRWLTGRGQVPEGRAAGGAGGVHGPGDRALVHWLPKRPWDGSSTWGRRCGCRRRRRAGRGQRSRWAIASPYGRSGRGSLPLNRLRGESWGAEGQPAPLATRNCAHQSCGRTRFGLARPDFKDKQTDNCSVGKRACSTRVSGGDELRGGRELRRRRGFRSGGELWRGRGFRRGGELWRRGFGGGGKLRRGVGSAVGVGPTGEGGVGVGVGNSQAVRRSATTASRREGTRREATRRC